MATVYGGRWRVSSSLGEGGQAHTFLVEDEDSGEFGYVLKRLRNVNRIARFEREVSALQAVSHAGIPPVIDHGMDEKGRPT